MKNSKFKTETKPLHKYRRSPKTDWSVKVRNYDDTRAARTIKDEGASEYNNSILEGHKKNTKQKDTSTKEEKEKDRGKYLPCMKQQ